MSSIDEAVGLLRDKTSIVVFTGSGASVASGIPTFEQGGLTDWGISRWEGDPEWRSEVWRLIFGVYWQTGPNAAHTATSKLCRAGIATHLTSNADGLCPGVEICGSARRIRCPDCKAQPHIEAVRDWWAAGDVMECSCGGTLRPDVVFLGEAFPLEVIIEATEAMETADALVLVGASELVGVWVEPLERAVEAQIPVIVINPDPPETQVEGADVVIRQPAEEALPAIVDGLLNRGAQ